VSWSALHGDLAEPAQCLALEASIEALLSLGPVDAIAHDLHPDFYSTRLAQSWAVRLGVPAIGVQHHHAHAAALQAEHGLRGPVIGLALDGVGLGDDGTAWGGELLWADGAAWQRLGALTPLRLPGGDAAAQEPWRMAAATLHALGRGDEIASRLALAHGETGTRLLRSMLDKQFNCPLTTSAGRWFDAAAGALGLGGKQAFEAQAAIALEQFATAWLNEHTLAPDASLTPLHADGNLNLLPLMASIWSLSEAGQAVTPERQGQGAALFHVNLADGLARWAVAAARRHGLDTIVLGGGCFYNRLLVQRLLDGVRQHSLASGPEPLHVLQAQTLSCGDAGLALGQAWAVAGAPDLSLSVLPTRNPSSVLP
jgi:hydrogenase maturation protein HypF